MAGNLRPCSLKEGKGKQYFADEEGNIYSKFGRKRAVHYWKRFRNIPNCHSYYPQVDECLISRLVCSAFHGEAIEGQECHHLNGNKFDNRPENLIWLSRKEHRLFDTVQRALRLCERDITRMSRDEIISLTRNYTLTE